MIFLNEKQISSGELVRLLRIEHLFQIDTWKKMKQEGKPYIAVFKLKDGKVKKSESGDVTYPTYIITNPVVCNIPEMGQVAVFFTNTLPVKSAGGRTQYPDPNYQFTDWQEIIDPLAETEKYLMFLLHPMCQQSPFNKGKYDYVLEDRVMESKQKLQSYIREFEALQYINELSGMQLRIFAGAFFAGVTQMSEEEIKLKLTQMVKGVADRTRGEGIERFYKAKESATTTFHGKIQIAIEKGIIKQEAINGMIRWVIKGIDTPVIPPQNTDAVLYLKKYLTENYDVAFYAIENALNGIDIESRIEEKITSKPNPVRIKINELIDNGIIWLDPKSKTVKCITDEGETDIVSLEDTRKWQSKLEEFFSDKKSKVNNEKADKFLNRLYEKVLI